MIRIYKDAELVGSGGNQHTPSSGKLSAEEIANKWTMKRFRTGNQPDGHSDFEFFQLLKEDVEEYAAQFVGQWISVDNPPETGKYVLLYNGHWRGVGKYLPDAEPEFTRWEDESSEWIEPKPTHWQPLPEPPTQITNKVNE